MLRLRHRAEDIARQRTWEAAGHPCRLGTTEERRQERSLYQRFLIEELAKRQPQIDRLIGKRRRRNRPL